MELTLFVDHQCNLRCTYCYNGDKFTRRMDEDTIRKSIALALQGRPRHIDFSFFGGEPLIHKDLLRFAIRQMDEAIAAMKGPKPTVRVIVNTNATLIDEEVLGMLENRLATVFVSLDGDREVHDRYRVDAGGHGSYDKVLQGIGRLRDRGIGFQLVSVFGVATAPHLGRTVRACADLGAAKVTLAPNFRDDWDEGAIEGLREGLRGAGDAWMEMFRAGRAYAIEPLHTKILTHLKGGIPCPSRCLLGGEEFTVAPTGRIYPCAQMVGEDLGGELVIGHVDRGIDSDARDRLQAAKDRVEDTCAPCELRTRCQSHCGCRHVALTGKLGEITAVLCEVESAVIDEADRVAETLYAEQCPAFIEYYYKRNWVPAGGALTQLRRSRDS
ncbi:MAG TPA: radical SAM protein [Polyangiaceae bacterium]|nr:radical SAM protein [Polyangiaceae bacterium]